MIDVKKYKSIFLDFRRISSELLTTTYNNPDTPLYRFKNYIDNDPIIKEIIDNEIKDVDYDFKNCFEIKDFGGWDYINIPVARNEHIKAMYDYLTYIVDNKLEVLNVASKYHHLGNKITDILRDFLDMAFKPLINFIVDELSKIIMIEEGEPMKGINITGNQSVINVADRNSTIYSNNQIAINDLDKIVELCNILKKEVLNLSVEEELKENLIDDLDIVQEQMSNNVEKPNRLKRAFTNIKSFLTTSASLITLTTTFSDSINKLITAVKPIIDKIN